MVKLTIGGDDITAVRKLITEDPRRAMVEWAIERERIRIRRQAGYEKPWTADPWLQKYFFCNAFRVHDKVTKFYMEWIKPLLEEEYPRYDLILFNTMMFRIFNHPETMARVGLITKSYDPAYVIEITNSMLASKRVVFGPAYIISNLGQSLPKNVLVARTLQQAWNSSTDMWLKIAADPRLEVAQEQCRKISMFGPFLRYEVVTDLSYHIMKDATDIYTWANLGPGAERGLNRLNRQPLTTKWKPHSALIAMRQVLEYMNETWSEYEELPENKLTMRDAEHTLCEFDKYSRIVLQQGRMKRHFDGGMIPGKDNRPADWKNKYTL